MSLHLKTLYHVRKKLIKLQAKMKESFGVSRCIAEVDNIIDLEKGKVRPCGLL